MERNSWRGIWITAALIGLCFYFYLADQMPLTGIQSAVQSNANNILPKPLATAQQGDAEEGEEDPEYMEEIEGFKVHSPCPGAQSSTVYNSTPNEGVARFRTSAQDTWKLTRRANNAGGGEGCKAHYYSLEFQLLECPPSYMASTFHVQSSTKDTIFAGRVGPRHRTEGGCGFYDASVPIVLASSRDESRPRANESDCGAAPVAVEAFWTSSYRNYVNRVDDMKMSERIKAGRDTLTTAEIADMLGEDRMKYLARYMDILPGFPLTLDLPADDDDKNKPQGNSSTVDVLPNCSDVPLADWLPVGVVSRPSNDQLWQFHSWRCKYQVWSRDELNYLFAGLRIRYMGDSHGQGENKNVQALVCPEANLTAFFKDHYECPRHNNSFTFGWRFYRGIHKSSGGDMDGIASDMRNVQPEACRRFLGVGLHNVTIITTPTWLFVYEIEEALHEYIRSIRDIIQLCRRMYPSEMEELVLLLQTPTASNILPKTFSPEDATMGTVADEASGWRQNHNYRQEAFSLKLYSELLDGGFVDGIIPVFDWTLGRNWKHSINTDGVHLNEAYYGEVFHLQTSAILSVMKFSKKWNIPLMSEDDPQARWFVGVPLE